MGTTPYDALEPEAFWRSAVAEQDPGRLRNLYQPKFKIDPLARIASAGSCFAQHVGRSLKANGFHYLDAEPPPIFLPQADHSKFGYGLFSARYGNIYTTRQLRQLVERAYGRFEPQDGIWETDGRFYDAFRPSIEPGGFSSPEELLALRQAHLNAVRNLLASADVFIFTLGLTETWLSRSDGAAYPMCPGTVAGTYDESRYVFHNLTYEDVVDDMRHVIGALREVNPRLQMLLTVSPVPLTATATGQHVLLATMASKAILRAAAAHLTASHEFVDYFPSFELIFGIQARGAYYEANLRSVRTSAVDMVMSHFFAQHGKGQADPSADVQARRREEEQALEDDVVCDEEQLDR
jgi:hypothetical protein